MLESALKAFNFDPAGLKTRIDLLKPEFDPISPWQGAPSYQLVAQVWAGLLKISADERTDADQISNGQTISLIIRHRTDLSDVARITYDTHLFELTSMRDPDQSKRWLVLEARRALGHE